MRYSFILIFFIYFSCNPIPNNVKRTLISAGDNRKGLEEVIRHYKAKGEKQKLKAAYFLIGNMEDQYTLEGVEIRKFDDMFRVFDSLNKLKTPVGKNLLERKWDSLIALKGRPLLKNLNYLPDCRTIKAQYLIENIELSFKLKEKSPWLKNLSFDEFCEAVLPYRTGHESIENWKSKCFYQYENFRDSIHADSALVLGKALHKVIPHVKWANILSEYPFDMPFSKMEMYRYGACPHVVQYDAMTYRANGFAVYIDYAPLWANFYRGHKWTVFVLEDGKHFPFERNYFLDRYNFDYTNAKVYRETFACQNVERPDTLEVPEWMIDEHRIDVTAEYNKTYDVAVKLDLLEFKKHYALICTFNGKNWSPQYYGTIKNGQTVFKNMGSGVVYIVAYLENGRLNPASKPFILEKDGKLTFLEANPNKFQKMLLVRKYPMHRWTRNYHLNMINGKFQGANRADFKDPVDLFTIIDFPENFETALISNPGKFRYIRYKSVDKAMGDVSELEFYGGERGNDTLKLCGKIIGYPEVPESLGTSYRNAFDENIDTYFNSGTWGLSWAGLDFGKPKRITKIRYCPRSDTNFILEGDQYELCYWGKNEWVSLGKKIAVKASVEFEKVPSGGLYILHDLSRGTEERVFTWEEGKQVFW